MHNTLSSLKMTSFGIHPGHHQNYASFRTYETTIQSSTNLGKRFNFLPHGVLKSQPYEHILTQMNSDWEQEKDVNIFKACV
jgi:hypothetical protein